MAPRDFLQTETIRLATLRLGDLVNTPLESRFNRIVRLARRALGVKAATISLLDDRREWIKAADGWELGELPLEHSLAASIVTHGVPTIVNDTLLDGRLSQHHLVTQAPKVRFCALYPLRDRLEHVIGALSAYDFVPRNSVEDMFGILGDVGQLAQRELFIVEACGAQEQLLIKLDSARRQALLDELTQLWNRRGALQLLTQAIAVGARQHTGVGVCLADLDRFKEVNDTHGHSVGDIVLKTVSAALVDSVRPTDTVCRWGGEEFLLIIPGVTVTQLTEILERARKQVAMRVVQTHSALVRTTLSLGGYVLPPHESATADDLVRRADEAMYQAKGAGRNVVVAA